MPVICSDANGTACYVEDGVTASGRNIPVIIPDSLLLQISDQIHHIDLAYGIGAAARKT